MGCHGSRKQYSQEEVALLTEELVLHFHASTTQQAHTVFCCKSRQGYLNETAFAEAAQELGLCVKNSGSSLQVETFFSSLNSPQGYPSHSLSVLAVLLGEGNGHDKAMTLFQMYDDTYSLELSKTQVARMLADLVNMSTQQLGLLVAGDQPGSLRYKEYLKSLTQVSAAFQQSLLEELTKDSQTLPRTQFLKLFANNSTWQTASNLRLAMVEWRKEHSRPQLVKA